jgi:hypothetical protein
MDRGAIFLLLALLILVGLFIFTPFSERRARRVSHDDQEISALMAERDRAINSLQELDFDFSLGKIPAEDYPDQRAALLKRGAEILRQLDVHQSEASASDAESRLEAAVAARRADAAVVKDQVLDADDELESLIISRRKSRKAKSVGFCPSCGKPVLGNDSFCPHCGKPVR